MNSRVAFSRRVRGIRILVFLALIPMMIGGLLTATNVAAGFDANDTVVVTTDALNLRSGPGLSADVMLVLQANQVLTITAGPVAAEGYHWYPVDAPMRPPDVIVKGWVAGEFVTLIEDVPGEDVPHDFPNGDVQVNTDQLNVRSGPGLTYPVVRTLSWGDAFFAGSPPVRADGYTWYTMNVPDRPPLGWVAGEFLVADTRVGFVPGEAVIVSEPVNLRAGAGVDADVLAVLPQGTRQTVTGASVFDGHYRWHPVTTASGVAGWVAGDFLTADPGGDPGGVVGATMVVDVPALNLRSGAGMSNAVSAILNQGTLLEVLSGPVAAGDFHWYEVRTGQGAEGWVIGEALADTSAPGFALDDAVRVIDGPLNLRASSGLGGTIVDALETDQVLLVTGGPVRQDGYTWYEVRTSGAIGWVAGEYLAYEPGGFPGEEGGS
jgi:N-acetylmuramoyl-L-alanine amidase